MLFFNTTLPSSVPPTDANGCWSVGIGSAFALAQFSKTPVQTGLAEMFGITATQYELNWKRAFPVKSNLHLLLLSIEGKEE